MTEALFLSGEDVRSLATPADYVQAVEAGYRDHGAGGQARPRVTLQRREPWGMLTAYTALLPGIQAAGGYLYDAGFEAGDAWFALPLFDAREGRLLAVLDGAALNPLKTGAAGAVAIDHLAREEACELALFGSGRQAWGQLRCAAVVRELEQVRVFSPTREHRESFAKRAEDRLGVPVRAAASPQEALDGADIAITATRSSEPVLPDQHLEDGAHVTAMGQYHPQRREIEPATVARALYVPDLRERVTQDAGAFLHALEQGLVTEDHVHAELGQVVAGSAAGRTGPQEVTLFDSGGTGIETVAAARMLYDKAQQAGVGTPLPFEPASQGMEDLRSG